MDRDYIRNLLFVTLRDQIRKDLNELNEQASNNYGTLNYKHLEFNCVSAITDGDILKLQIDFALDNGDKELFMQLTDQLNKFEANV